MNTRLSTLVIFGAAFMLGAALFITSENVQRMEKELTSIRGKLGYERDALRVLNAEWTYLNRPDRLEQLARNYLQLAPGTASQVMTDPSAIPEPINPILPTAKPNFIPASFKLQMATASTTPDTPAPSLPAKNLANNNSMTFKQLITRVADTPTTP